MDKEPKLCEACGKRPAVVAHCFHNLCDRCEPFVTEAINNAAGDIVCALQYAHGIGEWKRPKP